MSGLSAKEIEALMQSGRLSEADMRVLDRQLAKLEELKRRELSQQHASQGTH